MLPGNLPARVRVLSPPRDEELRFNRRMGTNSQFRTGLHDHGVSRTLFRANTFFPRELFSFRAITNLVFLALTHFCSSENERQSRLSFIYIYIYIYISRTVIRGPPVCIIIGPHPGHNGLSASRSKYYIPKAI